MWRILIFTGLLLSPTGPALAQVEVAPLAAPDAFSTPARDTGLGADLWRGTPVETARAVLPLLANRPLTPAAQTLARRVLATGATGPEGSAGDSALAGGRAQALIALGDVPGAARILDRASGLERSPELARAAAETALLTGDAPRACAIAQNLGAGRGETYWLRLRAFCQMEAGQTAQAQLTFDLAQTQARDAVFGRLMGAKLTGSAPGAASLRNGLDLALSRALALDLAPARPSPAVAAALTGAEPSPPVVDVAALDVTLGGIAGAIQAGLPPAEAVSALIAAASEANAASRARLQGAALLAAALLPEITGPDRARIAGFSTVEGRTSPGRRLALNAALEGRRAGEVALLVLWTAADAGAAGPNISDRVALVRALMRVGLLAEARAFALEGLAALK
jgi:hypothetical protein